MVRQREGKMKSLKELVKEYSELCGRAYVIARKIGDLICSKLSPILVDDIEYSVGWYGEGIDTICFYSPGHSVFSGKASQDDCCSLEDIIDELIPELGDHIDVPYGIFLDKDEAIKVRLALKELVDSGDEGKEGNQANR